MPRNPIIPIRVDEPTKQRWQTAAFEQGVGSLAEFIRRAVEEKIERGKTEPRNADDAARDALGVPRSTLPDKASRGSATTTSTGGKVFKGMDPKGGKAK